MARIYLFGGRSELGNSAATQILQVDSEHLSGVTKVQRGPNEGTDSFSIIWAPDSSESVLGTVRSIEFSKGDIALIALGSINNHDSVSKFSSLNKEDISELIWVNFTLPLIVASEVFDRLSEVGGGSIFVFTSAAALPPQAENLVYTHSKFALDATLGMLSASFKKSGVKVVRIRSSFSPTNLNKGRTATPLSVSTEEVGRAIARAHLTGQNVVWVPRVFRLVSFTLCLFPFLAPIAGRLIKGSRRA